MSGRWPERLWIVRHGESAGNVAREAAYAAGAQRIELAVRDVDVPLSARGTEQARALGRWFANNEAESRPDATNRPRANSRLDPSSRPARPGHPPRRPGPRDGLIRPACIDELMC